jgi:hypothetical protein
MQKTHQNHGYLMSNELLNFDTPTKLMNMDFILQCISPMYLKLWHIA